MGSPQRLVAARTVNTRTQVMPNKRGSDAAGNLVGRCSLLGVTNMVLALCLSAAGTRAAQASTGLVRQGLWQISVSMNVSGMSASRRPFTHKQCFTSRDVHDGRDILQINPGHSPCRFTDYQHSRGRVGWNVHCTGHTPASGHVGLIYGSDRYEGTITMSIAAPRHGPSTVTEQVRGQRIGNCR